MRRVSVRHPPSVRDARSSASSPWKTSPSGTHTAGTSRTPRRERGRGVEASGDRSESGGLQHGVGVHLAGRRRDQHVVGHGEVAATGERLAKGRQRERDRAAGLRCSKAAVRQRVHRGLRRLRVDRRCDRPHRLGAVALYRLRHSPRDSPLSPA